MNNAELKKRVDALDARIAALESGGAGNGAPVYRTKNPKQAFAELFFSENIEDDLKRIWINRDKEAGIWLLDKPLWDMAFGLVHKRFNHLTDNQKGFALDLMNTEKYRPVLQQLQVKLSA